VRKPKIVTVVRGVLTGQGATKTEAKADLDRHIDRILEPRQYVHVESRFNCIIIVTPTPCGYESRVLTPQQIAQHSKQHTSCTLCWSDSIIDVVMGARLHAAQLAWKAGDGEDHIQAAGLDHRRADSLRNWIVYQHDCAVTAANSNH
jgi:hypothetical protein